MMIYIDCEWNDYRGDLISMALVSQDGDEFYEVLGCDNPTDWVKHNVMPVLFKKAVSRDVFTTRLKDYLALFNNTSIKIIADWPEDISRFCDALIIGPGDRIGPADIEFVVSPMINRYSSDIPHNALHDALANMKGGCG